MKELFKVSAVGADDSTMQLDAKELSITIGDNELQIWVSSMENKQVLKLFSAHACFTLRPNACNGVSLSLERFERCSPTKT